MNQDLTTGNLKKVGNYIFDLDSVLGVGCFGKVYLGRDQISRNPVAVKIIERHSLENKPLIESFLSNEIKVMQSLQNPNIVQLKDILHTANNIYIVQEYCKDGDLRGYLNKHGKILPEKEALKILKDILNGFVEMIKMGVVHRDLKPENILINDGAFKIADFGFSKHVANHTKEVLASAVGTPLYMAPQIQMCETYSTKSDIWSIGMIYFEMLFGKVPWRFSTTYELINNILKIKLKIPSTPEVSELSKDFIRGALQVKEVDRMSWSEVFMHPLVQNYFQYKEKIVQLNKKFRGLVTSIREKIVEKKLDIDVLFGKIDENCNSHLDIHEFAKLFKLIDDKITREEVEYCFNKCDSNNDNSINIEEFKKHFEEPKKRRIARALLKYLKGRKEVFNGHMANLEKIEKRNNSFIKHSSSGSKTNTPDLSESKKFPIQETQVLSEKWIERAALLSQHEENSMKILKRMRDTIRIAKMDLKRVFWTFDKDNNKTLDEVEFGKFIRLIEKEVKSEEIAYLFNYFDDNRDGLITCEEFVFKFQEPVLTDSSGQALDRQNSELLKRSEEKLSARNNYDNSKTLVMMNQNPSNIQLPPKMPIQNSGPPLVGVKSNKFFAPKYQIFQTGERRDGKFDDSGRRDTGPYNNNSNSFDRYQEKNTVPIEPNRTYPIRDGNSHNPVMAPLVEQRISSGSQNRGHMNYTTAVVTLPEEKANRILGRIRTIVTRMNLDLSKIFWSFDKDNNQALDYLEFRKLIQLIDQESTEKDIMELFARFDTNGDGNISFSEFHDAIKNNSFVFKKRSFDGLPAPISLNPQFIQYRPFNYVEIIQNNNLYMGAYPSGLPYTNYPNLPQAGNLNFHGFQPSLPIFK